MLGQKNTCLWRGDGKAVGNWCVRTLWCVWGYASHGKTALAWLHPCPSGSSTPAGFTEGILGTFFSLLFFSKAVGSVSILVGFSVTCNQTFLVA